MSTPSSIPTTTGVRQPRVSVPGLTIEDLALAPDAAVIAALRGPDSTGTSALLFLDARTGDQHGAVAVGGEELAVLSTSWTVGASHNWQTGDIRVWRPVGGEPIGRLNPHRDRGVHALAISDRGDIAASLGEDGRVALWRPADGVVIGGFVPTSEVDLETATLAFSPDASLVAVRTDAETVELWDTAPLEFVDQLPETGAPVFSADGRWVASASATVSLYDLEAGTAPVTLPGRGPLAFTPDGSLLVAGVTDVSTTVWRTDTAMPHGYLKGGSPSALSPDGTVLALTGPGTELSLYEIATGQKVATLTGHRGAVQVLAVGPAGSVVVAACSDATLRVWA